MADRSDLFIQPAPGSDMIWLSAVTKYIVDNGWTDKDFIKNRVNGMEEYIKTLEPYTMEYAEKVTGVAKGDLITLAKAIHEAGSVAALWAMGVTQHGGGSDTSTAISNLLLITGNYGKPGTGTYPLRGHNNVQGASDFGSMPDSLPGYEKVTDEKVRAKYENIWGAKIPENPGFNNHEMVEGIHSGTIKAMYLKGEDMGLVDSNINHVHEAFENWTSLWYKISSYQERLNSRMLSFQQAQALKKKVLSRIPNAVYNVCIKSLNRLATQSLIGKS